MSKSAYDEDAYSPISHLASIVAPWWMDEGHVLMGMLTAAFDAGGDDTAPVLTVAGFISSVKDWKDFSRLWAERLARDNIKYFRASEAESFWGEFRQFRKRPEAERKRIRESLFEDLMKIVQSHTYRHFGCSIMNADFQKMNPALREEFYFTSYSVAGRTCEKDVREWLLYGDPYWRNAKVALEIVFEQGDKGKGKLQQRLSDDCCVSPEFRFKKDTVDKNGVFHHGFIPLQAADWLAYELCFATPRLVAGEFESTADLRWPLQQFLRKPGVPGIFSVEDIKRFEKNIEMFKEMRNWWSYLKNDTLSADANAKGKAAQ